jgi:DNA invertase Pin-like site-specific DNA recombinase
MSKVILSPNCELPRRRRGAEAVIAAVKEGLLPARSRASAKPTRNQLASTAARHGVRLETMTAARPVRVLLYVRASTPQQHRSTKRQPITTRQYCQRVFGNYVVVRTIIEYKTGKRRGGRVGLDEAIAMIGRDEADVVVVEATDRWSRSTRDALDLYVAVEKAGKELHSTNIGRLTELQVAVAAAMDSEQHKLLLSRSKDALLAGVAQGLVMNGVAFGYRAVPGKPGRRRFDRVQKPVVLDIYTMFLAGKNRPAHRHLPQRSRGQNPFRQAPLELGRRQGDPRKSPLWGLARLEHDHAGGRRGNGCCAKGPATGERVGKG